ncbi:hypothetical protein HAX54_001463 [Datura stramonium]|uniref:Uncharacterized protein n=1 Tax=Datura stramonium TaxID=4076 RepID=A0ABS8T312_DATST|nr:hypothetical protein [Datura stramonium]
MDRGYSSRCAKAKGRHGGGELYWSASIFGAMSSSSTLGMSVGFLGEQLLKADTWLGTERVHTKHMPTLVTLIPAVQSPEMGYQVRNDCLDRGVFEAGDDFCSVQGVSFSIWELSRDNLKAVKGVSFTWSRSEDFVSKSRLDKFLVSTSGEELTPCVIQFPLLRVVQSPGSKRSETLLEPRETVVLTPKNVQALRTLFNISHRLHNVLGPSWSLVLETLASLDRAIHSPHATTQEVSTAVPKLTRDSSGQYSDFHILSSLNSQLFESSALMHVSAVKSLLSALRQLSHQCMSAAVSGFGPTSSQKSGSISFSVERMLSILVNNAHSTF